MIDEEIKRDEVYRHQLNEDAERRRATNRAKAPTSIVIPPSDMSAMDSSGEATTPRANGIHATPTTPGLAIGTATPGAALPHVPEGAATNAMSPVDTRTSLAGRQSADAQDYFAAGIAPADSGKAAAASTTATESTDAKTDASNEKSKEKEKEKDKSADNGKSPTFGKKFRMSFGSKKLGRSASQATQEKPVVVDEKDGESEESSTHEKEVDDSFYGVIQKMRHEYDRQLAESPDKDVETGVKPSLASETPVIKLAPTTKIIIQEETSGGSANLYQGTVETVGRDADIVEQKAPMWLGDVLLQNQIPFKDPVKVSFVLHPMDDLPPIAVTDGNNRLNANRMLRVKKILSYVAERIEPPLEEPETDALKPEEYLELYCNDQVCFRRRRLLLAEMQSFRADAVPSC